MRFWLFIVLTLIFRCVQSQQMEVVSANSGFFTPENLIKDVFLQDGVQILNIKYTGSKRSVGYFFNGQNAVSMERGIILSTGLVESASNQNLSTNNASSGLSVANTTDPDLLQLASGSTEASLYEIEFIPLADTLRFRYAFASEEYPEFVCQFNDIFAFFLSGPGISGPYSNGGRNIATIPGQANTPVSINTVNSGNPAVANCPARNQNLFRINPFGSTSMVYDGHTVVLTATAVVVPCQRYIIKLAVADNRDNAFDSAVFLEARSFGAGSIKPELITASREEVIKEGCTPGKIVFRSSRKLPSDKIIPLTIQGNAQNGIDYQFLPSQVILPAGQDSLVLTINAIEDNITEGLETLLISFPTSICSRDTFSLSITENDLVPPNLPTDTTICPGRPILLNGTLPITIPQPKTFTDTIDKRISPPLTNVFSPIPVSGVGPTFLGPDMIESVCINVKHRWLDDLDIALVGPDGQFMVLTTDNGGNSNDYLGTCFKPASSIPITSVNDTIRRLFPPSGIVPAAVTQSFFNGSYSPEGKWGDLWPGRNKSNGTWKLSVIDDVAEIPEQAGVICDWSITFKPNFSLNYQWSKDADDPLNPITTLRPKTPGNYFVSATDRFGCTVKDSIQVKFFPGVLPPNPLCTSLSENSVTIGWTQDPTSLGYQLSINGGAFTSIPTGINAFTTNGLSLGQAVQYIVQAQGSGACGNVQDTVVCITRECSSPDVRLDSLIAPSCNGGNNGRVQMNVTGPNGPYTIFLDGKNNTSGRFSGLLANSYPVLIKDRFGCDTSFNIVVPSRPALALSNIQIIKPISCFGENDGILSVSPSGGTPPYRLQWSNGMSGVVATTFSAGDITVVVLDTLGCRLQSPILRLVEPSELVLVVQLDSITCFGSNNGSIRLSANGGTLPYSFSNLPANGSGPIWTNLQPRIYNPQVQDGNGCIARGTKEITDPDKVSIEEEIQKESCDPGGDGRITLILSGGKKPYSIVWSNNSTASTLFNISSGIFQVTVSDQNGCRENKSIFLDNYGLFDLDLQVNSVSCAEREDGKISINPSNGVPPFTYNWQDGNRQSERTGLKSGNYSVTISDFAGCKVDTMILIQPADTLRMSFQKQDPRCFGDSNGKIEFSGTGGKLPYQFSFEGDLFSSKSTFIRLPQGLFLNHSIKDSNGCLAKIDSINLAGKEQLLAEISPQDTTVLYQENIVFESEIQNGVAPFQISWQSLPFDSAYICEGCQRLDFIAEKDIRIRLAVIDANGCKVSTDAKLDVIFPNKILVPTAFSPNGDGENDVFAPLGPPIFKIEAFKIFNTWGGLVFDKSNFSIGSPTLSWDGNYQGRPSDSGVYTWFLIAKGPQGFINLEGNVTLLR
jgi:gliding motility-associated-like protein